MGGQAAIKLLPKLIQKTNKNLQYKKADSSNQSVLEIQTLLQILRDENFITNREPEYFIGSSRLFAIQSGLKKAQPNSIETLTIIEKALQIKKEFGDIDLDVYFEDGVTGSQISNFLNANPKYASSCNGEEVTIAVNVDGTDDVIQIDIINVKHKEDYFRMSQFASMADIVFGIKGVIRDLLVRSIAVTEPIPEAILKKIDKSICKSKAYKNIQEKYANSKIGYNLRYTLGGNGLAYRIHWTVDDVERSYSENGIELNQLHKFIPSIQPITYDQMNQIASLFGFNEGEEIHHVFSMSKKIPSFSIERRQNIWNNLAKILKSKLPTPTRVSGQITKKEALNALNYLKAYFGDIDYTMSDMLFAEAICMPSIPHIEQMTARQFHSLFTMGELEYSEKYDGSNVSFGLDHGTIYVKSKKGDRIYDPKKYTDMAEAYHNDIFQGFSNFLTMLNNSPIKKILHDAESKIGAPIQIFGEMFSKPHMNVISYSPEKIGKGAVVIFKIIKLNNNKGIDITSSNEGIEIQNLIFDKLNGICGWKFYAKTIHNWKIDPGTQSAIDDLCSESNQKIMISRKNKDHGDKIIAQMRMVKLLKKMKRSMLDHFADTPSMLGASEIEGIIIRNVETGAMAKVVDLDGFGQKRAEQWAGVDALKKERKNLYEKIQNDYMHFVDIVSLEDKQYQKLTEAIELNGGLFQTEDEIIDVLYNDAKTSILFNERLLVSNNLVNDLRSYIGKLTANLENNSFANSEAKNAYENATKGEQEKIDKFINKLSKKSDDDGYKAIIEFMIGSKAMGVLKDKFMIQ